MKNLTKYIAETLKAPYVNVDYQTNYIRYTDMSTGDEINKNDIVMNAVSNIKELEKLWSTFENYPDCAICLAKWGQGTNLNVDTENIYEFKNTRQGNIIHNRDDEREFYDLESFKKQKDWDGIVLINNSWIESRK